MSDSWFDREVMPRLTLETAYPGVKWTRRRGREWRARCPIHGGGNPESFCANVETLVSYCHACGHKGGPLRFWWAQQHGPNEVPRGRDAWLGMLELGERVGVEPPGTREVLRWDDRPVMREVREQVDEILYPPKPEVWALWRMGERPSVGAPDVLEAWGVDAASVDDEIRVLPHGLTWVPDWACSRGKRWGLDSYEILFPLRDADMRPCSFVARPLDVSRAAEGIKSASPRGVSTKRLVLANRAAQSAIRSGECSWGACIVREGERDWLFDAQRGEPVIGTRSGAWSTELVANMPAGWHLEIATDHDDRGEEYAREIVASLEAAERPDISWERTRREDAR